MCGAPAPKGCCLTVVSLHLARLRHHARQEDQARAAFIDRDFCSALVWANSSLRLDPTCPHARVLLGDILCALGREAGALRAYHRARRLAPEVAEPYWSISTVHCIAGRFEDALHYLELAQAKLRRGDGPLYEWIAEDRALALMQLGRTREALQAVRWGLRRRPSGVRLREMREELIAAGRPRSRLRPVSDAKRRPNPLFPSANSGGKKPE